MNITKISSHNFNAKSQSQGNRIVVRRIKQKLSMKHFRNLENKGKSNE